MINPKNNIEDNKEVSFIPMTLISDGFSNKHSYEVRLWGEVKKGFTHFQEGDIGVAKITPCFENRKSVIFSNLINEVGAGTTELHVLRPFAYSEIKKYIYWFINTESFIQRGISHFSGAVGQQRVGKDILENTLIPLPPLSEQRRIVEKMEKLLALVDDLETNKTDLQSYIKQAKSKVLEMAVRGELVPQNPEEEPASVLLERIKKEQKSSKSKGKTTEHNTHYEEELLFDIPENWVWCRLGEIGEIISGVSYKKTDIVEEGIRILRGGNIQNSKILLLEDDIYISEKYKNENNNIKKGDIVIVASTGSSLLIGKSGFVNQNFENIQIGAFLRIIRNREELCNFMKIIFESDFYKTYIRNLAKGTNINNIKNEYLINFFIPLPPLEEQHRIVEKIEEIFSALEFIEENLI